MSLKLLPPPLRRRHHSLLMRVSHNSNHSNNLRSLQIISKHLIIIRIPSTVITISQLPLHSMPATRRQSSSTMLLARWTSHNSRTTILSIVVVVVSRCSSLKTPNSSNQGIPSHLASSTAIINLLSRIIISKQIINSAQIITTQVVVVIHSPNNVNRINLVIVRLSIAEPPATTPSWKATLASSKILSWVEEETKSSSLWMEADSLTIPSTSRSRIQEQMQDSA